MKRIYHRITPRVLPLLLAALSALNPANSRGNQPPDAAAEMNRILATAFPPGAPGAAVLVVQNGAVKVRKAFGLANLGSRAPTDPADVLPICSITKQFTAVAILQLAEAGKLKLTDDLATWVPDYPTGGAKVTLAQLLSHMAGVPSGDEQPDWQKTWANALTPNQVLDFTRNKPLDFAPGSNFKYSNSGYILLGLVIEKASGQSYCDYIRDHILVPAAMTHSRFSNGENPVGDPVAGYSRSGKAWEPAARFNLIQTYSAGALLSTVDDMWAWEKALQSGRLLGASLLESAYAERRLPDGRGVHYGYGWEIDKLGAHDVIEHGGRIPGYTAYEARVPDADIYVVILSNTDSTSVPLRTLAGNLIRTALGETVAESAPATPSDIHDFVGKYRIGGNAMFVIAAEGNALIGQMGPGHRPLKMVAPDEFTTPGDEWRLTFVRDGAHKVQKILVKTDGPGPELVWPRVD